MIIPIFFLLLLFELSIFVFLKGRFCSRHMNSCVPILYIIIIIITLYYFINGGEKQFVVHAYNLFFVKFNLFHLSVVKAYSHPVLPSLVHPWECSSQSYSPVYVYLLSRRNVDLLVRFHLSIFPGFYNEDESQVQTT